MIAPTLLAIDQGTTSTRAILFSRDGDILVSSQKELRQYYPRKGWAEHDPEDIWGDTLAVCRDVMKAAPEASDRIAAIGVTNQRETTILWDRITGRPVHRAIVWQDRRTAGICEELAAKGAEPLIRSSTGLLIDPYFSATKIAWLLDNVDGARERAGRGELAFGTVDSWLLWKLTGGEVHATDATNAARTMLFNLQTQDWDDNLLALFDIPRALMPEVRDNAFEFGSTQPPLFGRPIPVRGMAGDQHAAMVGQACFEPGMVKATYGTGCFALMNIGDRFEESQNRLLTTPAYRLGGKVTYAIEGSIFIAGAAIQWLRDELEFFDHADESDRIASEVGDSGHGVYFVPALMGLGAPHWRPDVQGAIFGLRRDTGKAHIVRAALEAQAYQTRDLLFAMEADTGRSTGVLRVDGGMVASRFMCRFLADIIGGPVEVPTVSETTALGAARLAGLQAGVYEDIDDIAAIWQSGRRYEPSMPEPLRETLYEGWQQALRRLLA